MPVTMSRLTLFMLCLACLLVGLSVGNVEHAVEHGYSPLASAVSGVASLGMVVYLVRGALRQRRDA